MFRLAKEGYLLWWTIQQLRIQYRPVYNQAVDILRKRKKDLK